MKRTNIKILNPVVAVIFLLTTLSMVSADNDDRIQDCVSRSGEGAIYLKEF
ncbi:MAG: hypothetical protein GY790_13950, partial [Bacteroidetes bacterium]|nr:hypothetical protein [Bacteroidota bacterium]